MRIPALTLLLILSIPGFAPAPVSAADHEARLLIRDHRFEPTELKVPANAKVRLVVRNEDTTPEEFESHELNREKVIPGKSQAVIFVGPLAPGRYPFFGEFHEATARGVLVAE